jgi:hypothetical protein
MTTKNEFEQAMIDNYPAARNELSNIGMFGKQLDLKSRKLALKLAGLTLPEGKTVAWATPSGWTDEGYRSVVIIKNPRGAGRKTIGEKPRKQVRLSLDESAIIELKIIGHGNMSQAVHDLIRNNKKEK